MTNLDKALKALEEIAQLSGDGRRTANLPAIERIARQALSDLSSNKLEPGDVEKVARIIDPEAFSAEPDVFATEMYGSASPSRVSMAAAILARRRDEALHKAEDILSALGHGAT